MFVNSRAKTLFITSFILLFFFLIVTGLTLMENTNSLDKAVGVSLYRFAELDRFFIFLSHIGSRIFFYPALIAISIVLFLKKNWSLAAFLWCNLVGVRLLNTFLKSIFTRERPSLEHVVEAGFYSFPSGHSMNSMAFFGAFAILVLLLPISKWLKVSLFSFFVLLILSIGISRVYLGVHYPLDVLGGFLMGLAWLLFLSGVWMKLGEKNKNLFSIHNNG